ncbi:MAG: ABC transporter substrate-binding protein [Planctomycetes bacterium]|nr:ABC transporter substrate-binding protein [Planctomycetota bacterium]
MKIIICFLISFLLLSQFVVADVYNEPERILNTSVTKVLSVLSDEELTLEQKRQEVMDITNSVFSFPIMAKLSLGKKNWIKLDSKQREEFTCLFIELFQDFFSDKVSLFRGKEVVFGTPVIINKMRVRIPTVLHYYGKKVSVLYKMIKTRNGWKVYDIEIENVSQIQVYRTQYHHVIKSDNVEGLLVKMRGQRKR